MQEEVRVADQHKKLGLPPGMDPRNLDPRRVLDSAATERVLKAQALARAQAQAASTVVIGTVVTLVSSAFGFVAALAWNDAIRSMMTDLFVKMKLNLNGTEQLLVQAISFTIIAVIAIVILQRVAGRWAKKAAIGAAAGEGSY